MTQDTTFLFHRHWPVIAPHMRIETYDRDGGHRDPRVRIWLDYPFASTIEPLKLLMDCVACGRTIHPFRESVGHRVYFACTCPLDVDIRCSRTKAASREYMRIKYALRPDLAERLRK